MASSELSKRRSITPTDARVWRDDSRVFYDKELERIRSASDRASDHQYSDGDAKEKAIRIRARRKNPGIRITVYHHPYATLCTWLETARSKLGDSRQQALSRRRRENWQRKHSPLAQR